MKSILAQHFYPSLFSFFLAAVHLTPYNLSIVYKNNILSGNARPGNFPWTIKYANFFSLSVSTVWKTGKGPTGCNSPLLHFHPPKEHIRLNASTTRAVWSHQKAFSRFQLQSIHCCLLAAWRASTADTIISRFLAVPKEK